MAFTAALDYLPQLDPSTFILSDVSVYSPPDAKSNFSARSLTILDYLNNPLPGYPNPISFPIGGSNPDTFTIAGLTQDMALQITMTLTPIVINGGSVYTVTIDIATNRFLQQGLFNIQVSKNISPPLSPYADSVYRNNSIDIIIDENNSQTALLYGDFTGSQNAINLGEATIMNTQL
jgi:hypothetical protein